MERKKWTVPDFSLAKKEGRKITMLTAYDFFTAKVQEEAGIDTILVGDSLAMTVLGMNSTVPVTLEEMLHHTRAVTRGAPRTFVTVDMPFLSYHVSLEDTIRNAGRCLKEAGADGVKLEGGRNMAPAIRALTEAGIPVMGHIGLTPQTASQLGGYRVQGRSEAAAQRLLEDAQAVAEAGAFSLVLECIPTSLAQAISQDINIPTIGIGAGLHCDGQVLVFHDLVGLFDQFRPKFVKQYADVKSVLNRAVEDFAQEVRSGAYPSPEHSFE